MSEDIEISVIIPSYNEESRITKSLKDVQKFFSQKKFSYEIIVVDDGSRDKTSEVAKSLGISQLHVITHEKNQGKGKAVNTGVKNARGKYMLFTDADNSTPFYEFERLWPYGKEYPVVIGSRYISGSNIKIRQPLTRIVASRIGNLLTQVLLLPRISDTQCGFKLFQGSAAKKIFVKQTIWRWGFDIEILRIAKENKYKIAQVPVDWFNDEDTRVQSGGMFVKTLNELLRIKWNSLRGYYKS